MQRSLTYSLFLISFTANAQRGLFINGAEASLRVDTNAFISVDGDFKNIDCDPISQVRFNGRLYLSGNLQNEDSLKFAGTTPTAARFAKLILRNSSIYTSGNNATISGSVTPFFWSVELDKPFGSIQLNNNIICRDTIEFKNGQINMNGYIWKFRDPVGAVTVINHPWIKNEHSSSMFVANDLSDTGLVIYETIFDDSLDLNPANIGIELKGLVDPGSDVTFIRGFLPQTNVAKASVASYFTIVSPDYQLFTNTVVVKYFGSDLSKFSPGYLDASSLKLYTSANEDANWSPLISSNPLSLIGGSITLGKISANLADLDHPNITIDGYEFRLVVADPHCIHPPVSALVSDTVHICEGLSDTLDAGNGAYPPNTSLMWEWITSPRDYDRELAVVPDSTFQLFKVQLKDVRGCLTKDSVMLAPEAPYPVVEYLNHLNACLGDSATFKDTITISSGYFVNKWQFSNNSSLISQAQSLKWYFDHAGDHSAMITSTSDHGCGVTATVTNIVVYLPPSAGFNFSYSCVSDAVSFTSTSVSNYSALVISSHSWQLGDSSASTQINPVHIYNAPGFYPVRLIATSNFGCRDTVTDTIYISPRNISGFSVANVCLGDSVLPVNNVTCNTGNCSYSWSFSDGGASTQISPAHSFSVPGLYTIKQFINSAGACPDSSQKMVFINTLPFSSFQLSQTDRCVNEWLYASNNSTISSGAIVSYAWDYGDGNSSAFTNGSNTYSLSGIYLVGLTAFSDSGCVSTSSKTLQVHGQPTASFLSSTDCKGNPTQFQSNSQGTGLNYDWHFVTTQTSSISGASVSFVFPSSGVFSPTLFIEDVNGCSDTSTSQVTVKTVPTIPLNGQLSTCGTSYILDAQNPGCSFYWIPAGLQTPTLLVNSAGVQTVIVTHTNGCVSTASVGVTLNELVLPDLGTDKIVCGSIVLDAGYAGSTFSWNTGATTQSLLATTTQTYSVKVTDQNQCVGYDTISLVVNNVPSVSLGVDTALCENADGLRLQVSGNAESYTWQGGASSTSITVNNSGLYIVTGSLSNGCSQSDSIFVTFKTAPLLQFPSSLEGCGNVLLDAQNAGCKYKWSSGATSQYLIVNQTGLCHVTITNTLSGCSAGDTVDVTINPQVTVSLGPDTSICSNSKLLLNASNAGSQFLWLDGSGTQFMNVTGPGLYGVTVTGTGGCKGTDFASITVQPVSQVNLGPSLRYLCSDKPLLLETNATGVHTWGLNGIQHNGGSSYLISEAGKYWVSVTSGGCASSDTVDVFVTTNTIQALFLASTIDTVNKPVQFLNLSEPPPTSQLWHFGDGTSSTALNPLHTYFLPTDYSVTLEVSNGFCSDVLTKSLNVLFRKRDSDSVNGTVLNIEAMNVFPNPASDYAFIHTRLTRDAELECFVYDVGGRLLFSQFSAPAQRHQNKIPLAGMANGMYLFYVRATDMYGQVSRYSKIIKTE